MTGGLPFEIRSLTGQETIDDARALRMVMASLDDDLMALGAISLDVYTDPRGSDIALWQLIIGLSHAWCVQMLLVTDKKTLQAGIREVLTEHEKSAQI